MIIIIDAYNVLKQIIKSSHATERERSMFINNIISYAHKKNNDVVLVFDGGQSARPETFKKSGIKIVYAGYHLSADDYIKKYISEHVSQKLILVSSDRALYSFAMRHGLATIDALAFYELMQQELTKQSAIVMQKSHEHAKKLKHDVEYENPELDALMYETDYVMFKEENSETEHNKHKKLSKDEKKLLKLVKKL